MMPPSAELPDDDEAGAELGLLSGMLFHALRRAEAAVLHDLHEAMAAEGLRAHALSALIVLRHNPGMRQTQVSFALGMHSPNLVALVDMLEERGLAERRVIAGDRRAKGLFLTALGAETLARLEAIAQRHEARMRDRLGAEGRAQLLALLHRLTSRPPDPLD